MARFTGNSITYSSSIQILDAHDTYESFILEHPTGSPGDAHLAGTHLYSWSPETNAWIDAGEWVGPQGPAGADGIDGDPLDFLAVPSDVVPDEDNLHSLGTPDRRWNGLHLGPDSIYMQDTSTNDPVEIVVTDGELLLDGVANLRIGAVTFNDETIQTTAAVNADWNAVSGQAQILNKPDLSAVGVPVETTYTVAGGTEGTQPTFSSDPLFSGAYIQNGPLVHFQIQVDFDNITNFGTGQYQVSLHFPAKYPYKLRDGCLHHISSGREYAMSGHVAANDTVMHLFSTDKEGNSVIDIEFTYNHPVTLSTADNFHIAGSYIKSD